MVRVFELIDVDLYSLVQSLSEEPQFPNCWIEEVNGLITLIKVEDPTFYSIDLIQDSKGGNEMESSFREENANTADSILGADAPTNMYIASLLG